MDVLSLFSGIGAFEKALEKQKINFNLVGFAEIDKYASKVYSAMHNISEDLNLGDITKIDENNLPYFDLMTWGFPCTDVSIAGIQKGFVDENGHKTRSGLYYDGLRILKSKLPKYSIIENVKALTQKKFKNEFNQMLKDLEELGYTNYYKVLNSKDFGVPQNRERVFIVSILGGHESFEFPDPFDNGVRLKYLLEKDVDEKYYISEEKTKNLIEQLKEKENGKCITLTRERQRGLSSIEYKDHLKMLEPNECICVGRAEGINGHDYLKRVYSPEGCSPTIPTICGGNHEPKIFQDKPQYRIRKLTPKECWRLQGFNDSDFETAKQTLNKSFYNGKDKSNSQLYKMAGNSITVNVLEEIFKKLFNFKTYTDLEIALLKYYNYPIVA